MIAEIRRLSARRTAGWLRAVAIVLGVAFAVGVANLTIWPTGGTGPRNAVPFTTIWRYLTTDYPPRIRLRNLGGNLAMLVPLGVLLATITTWCPRRVLVSTVATAAGIELWQLLVATGRSVDVDDVILNSAGGVVGFISGLLLMGVLEVVAPGALEGSMRERAVGADDRGSDPLAP